jgi:hypothetical protein
MNLDERSVFAAFAPFLHRLSTVTWAGARSATQGSRLQRDGAVGRIRPTTPTMLVASVFDGAAQRVELSIVHQELHASCSCGEAPCAHAVAVALEAARLARQAQSSVAQQTDVLAALRSRLARPNPPEKVQEPLKMLSDLARMPLDAAVDMVALSWRQSLRHGPQDIQDLLGLSDRLEAHAREDHAMTRDLATRLLAALGATKVVFSGIPEALEPAIRLLARLALDRPLELGPAWNQLFDLAESGHPQVAVHVALGLDQAAVRSAELATALTEMLEGRVLAQRATWREVAVPTSRDTLADGLVVALVRHDNVALALELTRLWPPMRSGTLALAEVLGAQGRATEILQVAEHYDPRGETWQALMATAMAAALPEHPNAARMLANAAWRRGPNLPTFNQLATLYAGPLWPEQRHTLAMQALVEDDVSWLAERLAQEPDPVGALLDIALQWPLRERFQREALHHLEKLSPEAAFRIRALRVHSLVVTNVAARTLKDELLHLKDCAATLGEPGLASDLARLLAREVGEKAAWVNAVSAVFGKA